VINFCQLQRYIVYLSESKIKQLYFMKNLCSFLFLLFVTSALNAQSINGTVTDNNGMPIPGVNVVSKASKTSTVTDLDGKFSIKSALNDVLQFSFIGYETVSKKAVSETLNIVLKEQPNNLTEVVVVGYGTKKAGSITGSVSQIKSEEILKNPAQSAIQAIQGKAAGVNIVTNDEPGKAPNIIIRGLGTVTGASSPLYIIDGVETNGLNGLSSNDIATIDILKDAASLSIYGQKGANGVVFVTTKKGKKGDIKVTVDSYFGIKDIMTKVKLADAYRYAYYNNSALGSSTFFNLSPNVNTNWLNEITKTGEVVNNSFSLSGASDNASYYLSASNYEEKGILMGSEYRRTNVTTNNEFKLFNDKVKVTQFLNFTNENNTPKPLHAFTEAYKQAPIMPVYNPDGTFAQPFVNDQGYNDVDGIRYNNVANPVAMLMDVNNKSRNLYFTGSIGVEMQITNYLKFNSRYGGNYGVEKSFSYNNIRNTVSENYNSLSQSRSNFYNWNWDNFFTADKKFDKHTFNFVLGMSKSVTGNSDYLTATRYNVPVQSNYWSLDFSTNNTSASPSSIVSNRSTTPVVNIAYFTRIDYDYDNKYLVTAIVRREGISSFVKNQRYTNFPSLSAGWIASNEDFLKDNKVINYLKIKASYGIVGNGRGSYALNTVNFTVGQNNYPFSSNQSIYPGSIPDYEVDSNLTWEKMKEFDFGVDFKTLNRNLSGTIDFYHRKNTDIILPVDLPSAISGDDPVYQNVGTVTNQGVEITLNYKHKINDNWDYSISGNVSMNDNELSDVTSPFFKNLSGGNLGNGVDVKQVVVGESLGSFYVYQQTGYNADGWFEYSSEKVVAGSYLPKYTFGLNFNLNYKSFDFSVYTYGVAGNKIYNGKKAQRFGNENVEYDLLNSFWTPSTPNATNPKPFNDVPPALSYYVEDGSYLRVNNISIGYTLPNIWNKINKIRVYATATNPFIFTKYSGYSPEVSGDPLGGAGIELDAYPTNKTFIFGVNLNF